MSTNRNTKIKLIAFGFVIQFLFAQSAFATTSNAAVGIEVFAMDTIAGYGTVLKTSATLPGQAIVFTVQQPNGQQLLLDAVSDSMGVAKYELGDYHTRIAGIYYVSAEIKNSRKPGAPKPFRVYTDSVSSSRSTVDVSLGTVQIDKDPSPVISVQLTDAYGNSIENHQLRVISNRNSDTVRSLGKNEFEVSSTRPGLSTYTVYDLTSETVLENRVQILFHLGDAPAVGGDDKSDSAEDLVADSSGVSSSTANAVHTFEFEEIPEKISMNDPTTLTIAAYDNKKNVVADYKGTVHFAVTSANANLANLPEDYTFQEKDLGKHTFSLGFQFQQEGSYTVRVSDKENEKIYGEKEIVVSAAKEGAVTATGGVTITSPSAGKSRNNTEAVSGSAPAGKDVKIYDNNVEIGKITAGVDGKFTFTPSALADGDHEFYAASVSEQGKVLGTSSKVTISLDSKPPEISSFVFEPAEDVVPGNPVQATLVSEPDLSKISISVNDVLSDLTPNSDQPGTYSGAISAPLTPGEYKAKVFLADELGNEISFDDQGILKVAGSQKPTAVTNINVFPADGRVNLVWNAATDDGVITKYRIYYGSSADALTEQIETNDNALTWYVPNLENGTEYFFQIMAVDEQNQEGEASAVVNARPDASLNVSFPAAPGVMGESGPEFLWLLLPSFAGARLLRRKLKR